LLHAWGKARRNAVLALALREDQRIAANSALSTSTWASFIAGLALARLLAICGCGGVPLLYVHPHRAPGAVLPLWPPGRTRAWIGLRLKASGVVVF